MKKIKSNEKDISSIIYHLKENPERERERFLHRKKNKPFKEKTSPLFFLSTSF